MLITCPLFISVHNIPQRRTTLYFIPRLLASRFTSSFLAHLRNGIALTPSITYCFVNPLIAVLLYLTCGLVKTQWICVLSALSFSFTTFFGSSGTWLIIQLAHLLMVVLALFQRFLGAADVGGITYISGTGVGGTPCMSGTGSLSRIISSAFLSL